MLHKARKGQAGDLSRGISYTGRAALERAILFRLKIAARAACLPIAASGTPARTVPSAHNGLLQPPLRSRVRASRRMTSDVLLNNNSAIASPQDTTYLPYGIRFITCGTVLGIISLSSLLIVRRFTSRDHCGTRRARRRQGQGGGGRRTGEPLIALPDSYLLSQWHHSLPVSCACWWYSCSLIPCHLCPTVSVPICRVASHLLFIGSRRVVCSMS